MRRCLTTILLCIVSAAAQDVSGPSRETLHRVAQAYADVRGYRVEASVTNSSKARQAETESWSSDLVVTYSAPAQWRLEDKSRGDAIAYHDHGVSRFNGVYITFRGNGAPTPAPDNPPFTYSPFAPDWVQQGGRMSTAMSPMPKALPSGARRISVDDSALWRRALSEIGFADYSAIEKDLKSARLLHEEDVTVDGDTVHCAVIEATYPRRQTRTFWVDTRRYAVVRELDSGEKGKAEHEIDVSKLDWDVNIPHSVFELRDLPVHDSAAKQLGPAMIHRGCQGPVKTEEARIAGLSGTLKMSYIVDVDGLPVDIRVDSPLGLGLDEKAVSCISETEYQPRVKDGQPVPAHASVVMAFGGAAGNWRLSRASFHTEKGVERPHFRSAPYPDDQSHAQGTFQLQLTIDKSGTPRDIKVISSASSDLDRQAAKLVSRWRFTPGQANGVPVDVEAEFDLTLGAAGKVIVQNRGN